MHMEIHPQAERERVMAELNTDRFNGTVEVPEWDLIVEMLQEGLIDRLCGEVAVAKESLELIERLIARVSGEDA